MAKTVSTADWDDNINKRPSIQAIEASKLKVFKAQAKYGASDNYVSGGDTFDLHTGKVRTVLYVTPAFTGGLVAEYDVTNKKVKVYGQEPTDATAGIVALKELANASTLTNSKTFDFLICGI